MPAFVTHTRNIACYSLSLHDALPIFRMWVERGQLVQQADAVAFRFAHTQNSTAADGNAGLTHRGDRLLRWNSGYRSEEHTSELQSLRHLVCRLLLDKIN